MAAGALAGPGDVDKATAALAGVSSAVAGMVDGVVSSDKVLHRSSKEFEVCQSVYTFSIFMSYTVLKQQQFNSHLNVSASLTEINHTRFLYLSMKRALSFVILKKKQHNCLHGKMTKKLSKNMSRFFFPLLLYPVTFDIKLLSQNLSRFMSVLVF